MPTTVTSPRLGASVTATLSAGAAPAPTTSGVNHSASSSPVVGSSAGQVNLVYSKAFTVSAGAPLTLNLNSLTDPLGGAINFTRVAGLLVTNDAASAGQDMTVGGAAGDVLAGTITVQANGGAALVIAPNPGLNAAGTTLTISIASGTNVPGKLTLVGR